MPLTRAIRPSGESDASHMGRLRGGLNVTLSNGLVDHAGDVMKKCNNVGRTTCILRFGGEELMVS